MKYVTQASFENGTGLNAEVILTKLMKKDNLEIIIRKYLKVSGVNGRLMLLLFIYLTVK